MNDKDNVFWVWINKLSPKKEQKNDKTSTNMQIHVPNMSDFAHTDTLSSIRLCEVIRFCFKIYIKLFIIF